MRTEVFDAGEEDDHAIVEGLRATTVRLVAPRSVARTRAGQTAITTLYAQLAMMGLRIDLDVPDVELAAPQPPLRGTRIASSLAEYGDDLVPGGASPDSQQPDIAFVVGADGRDVDVRVGWDRTRVFVGPGGMDLPTADDRLPFAPIGAGAAAAVEGLRSALGRAAEAVGRPVPVDPRWHRSQERVVALDLSHVVRSPDPQVGRLDIVSAGAISNGALYALLRHPDVAAAVRVIDEDLLDLGNLNRYALARRSLVGEKKTDVLSMFSSEAVCITGVDKRFTEESADLLRPSAAMVLVGVDNIPSRWLAQREALSSRLIVGSTDHFFVFDDEHVPGSACAGCSHPRNEGTSGTIPTISFVSLWAGLVQAALLVSRPRSDGATGVYVHPLGLDKGRGIDVFVPGTVPNCPVGCGASRPA